MWGKVLCRDVKPRSSLGETEHKMVKFKIMRKGSKGSNRNTNLDFRKADFDWFSGTCLEKFLGFWREDRSRRVLSVQKDWVREYLNRLGVQYMETHRMHYKCWGIWPVSLFGSLGWSEDIPEGREKGNTTILFQKSKRIDFSSVPGKIMELLTLETISELK